MCEWGCANNCLTYGQHIRAKGLSYNGCFPTRSTGAGQSDGTRQKKWDAECDAYRAAAKEGIEPDGTTKAKVEFAKAMSDHAGVPYGTPQFKEQVINKTLERYT